MDVIEDQLVLNRTLPRTLKALLLEPGFLTNEYVAGRIARYIPPFRLYLVASVVFFLLLSFISQRALAKVGIDGTPSDSTSVAADSTSVAADPTKPEAAAPTEASDATIQPWARNMTINTGFGRDSLVKARIIERYGRLPIDQALREFLPEYVEYLPRMVFVMLPLFAFMLKVLYIRRKRYYAEHFVFALHVHAFLFVTFILMLLIRNEYFILAASLWIFAYIWLAMKRVYRQGWFRTTVKWWILGWTYFTVLNLGLVATIFVTLLV